jgi:hypothetical protein
MAKILFMIKRLTVLSMFVYTVFLLNACSKTTQFEDVWESSLKGCSVNCHSPDGVGMGLDLGPDMSTPDKFYANVVGKSVAGNYAAWAVGRTGTCDNVQLIKAGDAGNSLVVGSLVQVTSDNIAAKFNCVTTYTIHETNNVTDSTQTWSDLVDWINDGAKKE